tara:strand:+ start:768 stop:1736 length:969 start_codon:yes stop_codon:yes gene_type:complete
MVNDPMVSVVIASYNRADFIYDSIVSVQNQTFTDKEIIVVDDGSTDDTRSILQEFGGQISVIYQSNQGRSAARNNGVMNAKGRLIAFLDSDDVWMHDKLDKQVDMLFDKSDVGLIHTFSDVIDSSGIFIPHESKLRQKLHTQSVKKGYSYESLSENCVMFLSTVMVRRDCWDDVGPMDITIPAFEDWDWYMRLSRKYNVGVIPEILVHFRLHESNTSQKEFFQGRILTCEKHLKWLNEQTAGNENVLNVRRNFYLQLAGAYYVHNDSLQVGLYMRKAIEIDRNVVFNLYNLRYILTMLFSDRVSNTLRQLKRLVIKLMIRNR